MINNSQNTNFKSRIVVSYKAYLAKTPASLYLCGKRVEHPWTLKEAKVLNDEGFTDGIGTCVAGIVKEKNGDNFYIFHFDPHDNANPWTKLKRGFRAELKKLRKDNPKSQLEGIIVGGKSSDAESKKQVENLVNLLKKLRVKTTEMLFQPILGCCSFHYSLPSDEMVMSVLSLKQDTFLKKEDLEKHFEKISIKDEDSFEFRGD